MQILLLPHFLGTITTGEVQGDLLGSIIQNGRHQLHATHANGEKATQCIFQGNLDN